MPLTHKQKKSIRDVVSGRHFEDKRHMQAKKRVEVARHMAKATALENAKNP